MIITIDGPAGSGKSTIGRLLARRLGFKFIDTGAVYRTFTLFALENHFIKKKLLEKKFLTAIRKTHIDFKITKGGIKTFLNREDVSEKIRKNIISLNVHLIAEKKNIRKEVTEIIRKLAKKFQNVVTEGRDQGSVVFPDADLKFYLWATPEERAKRRLKDLRKIGENKDFKTILKEIIERDKRDMNRRYSPLKKTKDMIFIDSTNLSKMQVVRLMLGYKKNYV